jgi:hypothetical protein
MKLFLGIGGIVSLAFVTLALFELRSVVLFRADVAICIWAFVSGLGLSLGLSAFCMRNRIAALEKHLLERK